MLMRTLIVAAAFAVGGCSTLTEYGSVRKETVTNEQGHIVGYKQLLRSERTGEVIAQVSMFKPYFDQHGELAGYEETARDGGSIIRDLGGRPIGGRFSDLRSRKGMTIVFLPQDSTKVAARPAVPGLVQLMASLSASDLRRIQ